MTFAADRILRDIFPVIDLHIASNQPQTDRNRLIYERYHAGELMSELSEAFGISRQRISQIVQEYRP
jgi:hypothetical protein